MLFIFYVDNKIKFGMSSFSWNQLAVLIHTNNCRNRYS